MSTEKMETVFGKRAIPVISNELNHIHGGLYFTASVTKADLGAAALLYIEMIIPENIEVHLKSFSYYNGDDGHFEFVEAPTLTTGVTPLTAYNKYRRSVKKSGIVLKSNPTGISGGTVLDPMFFKGTNQAPGILITNDTEWILKPSTTYLLRLENNGAGAEQALLKAGWCEEPV